MTDIYQQTISVTDSDKLPDDEFLNIISLRCLSAQGM